MKRKLQILFLLLSFRAYARNLFFILFLFYSFSAPSQTIRQYYKEGKKAYEFGDYNLAANQFYGALKQDFSITKIAFKYAESCRLSFQYEEAEKWYRKVYYQNDLQYPTALYWYAVMLKNRGYYQKAQRYFDNYYKQHSADNDYFSQKAKYEIYSCEKAHYLMQEINGVDIKTLDTIINSPYSELGAFDINDSILFFSSYNFIEDTTNKKAFTSKIYFARKQDSLWVESNLYDSIINISNANVSNFSFNEDLQTLYFSVTNINANSKIYKSEINNGVWTKPKELPNSVNLSGYNNTQPCIAKTPEGNKLLFVSDRPEGFGKNDIWYCDIDKNGNIGDAFNIGEKINTIDDELSPYYSFKDSLLYFSSEYYANLGGFDIFKIKGDFYYWHEVENVGFPINSQFNDLYYKINYDSTKAYFVSNRGKTGENCCNDIYYHDLKVINRDSLKLVAKKNILVKEMKQLIPITLYFHNDEPNPRTTDTITSINYETTVKLYLEMLEEYKNQYSKTLRGDEKLNAENNIESFFSGQVEEGFNQLEKFAQRLESLLEQGENVVITLKGYTSPLNTAEYNKKLAKRRVSSLKNYFLEYNNGIFAKYLDKESNYLKFKLEAIGEEFANTNVSDNINDTRNSVYSPAAAGERRIQIIAVSVPD